MFRIELTSLRHYWLIDKAFSATSLSTSTTLIFGMEVTVFILGVTAALRLRFLQLSKLSKCLMSTSGDRDWVWVGKGLSDFFNFLNNLSMLFILIIKLNMDTTNAPQIIEHLSKTLQFTPYDTHWVPGSAKFVLAGQPPKANGILEVIQLNKQEFKTLSTISHPKGVKCGTFGASDKVGSSYAFGDFEGKLNILDLESRKLTFSVKAHENLVNAIDGFGGQESGYGAPELVTGGRDGCVRVWDPRQKSPVVSLEPVDKEIVPDAWCVGIGNSFNNEERVIAAGYDNGDLKMFDLKKNQLIWDTNVRNGVCGLEFDRKDIQMNKLVATTLESKVNVFDLRTYHPTQGYTCLEEVGQKSTIWGAKHLPQNRDIFATMGGNGVLNLYKYNYPPQRQIKDSENRPKGVVGKLELLNSQEVAQQPISSFDWNKEKIGLGVFCGLDQTCKVIITTKLNLY